MFGFSVYVEKKNSFEFTGAAGKICIEATQIILAENIKGCFKNKMFFLKFVLLFPKWYFVYKCSQP